MLWVGRLIFNAEDFSLRLTGNGIRHRIVEHRDRSALDPAFNIAGRGGVEHRDDSDDVAYRTVIGIQWIGLIRHLLAVVETIPVGIALKRVCAAGDLLAVRKSIHVRVLITVEDIVVVRVGIGRVGLQGNFACVREFIGVEVLIAVGDVIAIRVWVARIEAEEGFQRIGHAIVVAVLVDIENGKIPGYNGFC